MGVIIQRSGQNSTTLRVSNHYSLFDFFIERWYNRGMDKRDRTMEYHSHCDRGHEWTEENTYTMPSGTKICYACNRSTNWAKAGFPDVFYKFYEFPDAVYTGLDPL